jgi:hypothetical protein
MGLLPGAASAENIMKSKPPKTRPRVFVSVPDDRHLDDRRKALKRAILKRIADNDIELVGFETEQFGAGIAMNREIWTVERASKLIKKCDGALVLALARRTVEILGPFREANREPVSLPTVYNHLEGALAVSAHLPVFILFEENMDRAGIFDSGIKPASIPQGTGDEWIDTESFKMHFNAWNVQLRDRRDVFLGYCSKANSCALEIRSYLEENGFSVLDWSRDFKPAGATILEEIEGASKRCRCAVFLFTRDDELGKKAQAKASFEAIPRDNVLLEAGYFTQARGKERVAIIREAGAKMPADLGGIIYLSLEDRSRTLLVRKQLIKFLDLAL